MKQKFPLLVLLASAVLLQGCVIAALGAGVGAAAMYGNAVQRDAYVRYRTDMERLNFDRERAGMLPTSIMTYEQWDNGQR